MPCRFCDCKRIDLSFTPPHLPNEYMSTKKMKNKIREAIKNVFAKSVRKRGYPFTDVFCEHIFDGLPYLSFAPPPSSSPPRCKRLSSRLPALNDERQGKRIAWHWLVKSNSNQQRWEKKCGRISSKIQDKRERWRRRASTSADFSTKAGTLSVRHWRWRWRYILCKANIWNYWILHSFMWIRIKLYFSSSQTQNFVWQSAFYRSLLTPNPFMRSV